MAVKSKHSHEHFTVSFFSVVKPVPEFTNSFYPILYCFFCQPNEQLKTEFSRCADDSLFGSMDHVTKFVAARLPESYDENVSYQVPVMLTSFSIFNLKPTYCQDLSCSSIFSTFLLFAETKEADTYGARNVFNYFTCSWEACFWYWGDR